MKYSGEEIVKDAESLQLFLKMIETKEIMSLGHYYVV